MRAPARNTAASGSHDYMTDTPCAKSEGLHRELTGSFQHTTFCTRRHLSVHADRVQQLAIPVRRRPQSARLRTPVCLFSQRWEKTARACGESTTFCRPPRAQLTFWTSDTLAPARRYLALRAFLRKCVGAELLQCWSTQRCWVRAAVKWKRVIHTSVYLTFAFPPQMQARTLR